MVVVVGEEEGVEAGRGRGGGIGVIGEEVRVGGEGVRGGGEGWGKNVQGVPHPLGISNRIVARCSGRWGGSKRSGEGMQGGSCGQHNGS